MNSRIISEAIHKIVNINSGLSEDALRNLLIASGWEKLDIEQGMNEFRQISIAKNAIVRGKSPEIEAINEVSQAPSNLPVEETKNSINHEIELPEAQELHKVEDHIKSALKIPQNTETDLTHKVDREISNIMVYVNALLLVVLLAILAIYVIRFRL